MGCDGVGVDPCCWRRIFNRSARPRRRATPGRHSRRPSPGVLGIRDDAEQSSFMGDIMAIGVAVGRKAILW